MIKPTQHMFTVSYGDRASHCVRCGVLSNSRWAVEPCRRQSAAGEIFTHVAFGAIMVLISALVISKLL
jgi:hypothetical protein